MPGPRILTITLNPALDVTTTTERLLPQQKLRCDPPRYDPGGGGINVSRVIKELGGTSTAFAVLGGGTGTRIETMLRSVGIELDIWPIESDTRFSLTAMEAATGLHYRFVLPGPQITAAAGILAHLGDIAGNYDYVVASGSLPPGLPGDFYGQIADHAQRAGSRLILDTHGEALRSAMPHRPFLIRLNHHEARELIGGDPNEAAHQFARELIRRDAAENAIVTMGEQGAILATSERTIEIRPPRVAVRSMVGAGDSFVGALTLALSRGWPMPRAARYGVAAAAAAVTTEATELCKADKVEALFEAISREPDLVA
jgi:6-phosphofructokinase 2